MCPHLITGQHNPSALLHPNASTGRLHWVGSNYIRQLSERMLISQKNIKLLKTIGEGRYILSPSFIWHCVVTYLMYSVHIQSPITFCWVVLASLQFSSQDYEFQRKCWTSYSNMYIYSTIYLISCWPTNLGQQSFHCYTLMLSSNSVPAFYCMEAYLTTTTCLYSNCCTVTAAVQHNPQDSGSSGPWSLVLIQCL